MDEDVRYILRAIELARLARERGNHGFGALLVADDKTEVVGPILPSEGRRVHEGFW